MFFRKNTNNPVKYKAKLYKATEPNETKTALEEVLIPYIGDVAKARDEDVILQCCNSDHPLDKLAIGFAYKNKGAKFRKEALGFINAFLDNEVPIPCYTHRRKSWGNEIVSHWMIFSTLADLYEKEGEYNKSIECLKKCQDYSNNNNPSDFTRIGNVLIKKDLNEAVRYYVELINSDFYLLHKRSIDAAYSDVIKKVETGYRYKPRKRNS